MTYTDHDIAIIGGGIFGISIAKHLSERTEYDICIIEKEYQLAAHQSGRNSGVLHPGLALELKPGTRKAAFAIEGSKRLRDYCQKNDLPIRDTGLLLVGGTEEEVDELQNVRERVEKLDIDLEFLDSQAEIHQLEPNVEGRAALYTPDSSTVDGETITTHMANEAWSEGVEFYLGHEVQGVSQKNGYTDIKTNKGSIDAGYLVNAAGSSALRIAHRLDIATDLSMIPLRGQYYELAPKSRDLINTNVYPTSMPPRIPNQVEVHFTRRPDNKVIVGPTGMIALGIDTYGKTEFDLSEIYRTLSSPNFWQFLTSPKTMRIAWWELNKTYRKKTFFNQCKKLVPSIQMDEIKPSYVGITHSLIDENGDFIDGSVFAHGERSTHLLRPKPGLTSSLTIGEFIAEVVEDRY